MKTGDQNQLEPLRLNVDGTAGTGKSFLIWTITIALRELFSDGPITYDPVVCLAPTGVAAFGIRGWTINFGLMIPVKEGTEFNQLGQSSLARFQTHWKEIKLLILDEKSMVGRSQVGRMDHHLCQAYPQNADEILGGIPAYSLEILHNCLLWVTVLCIQTNHLHIVQVFMPRAVVCLSHSINL